MELLGRWGRGRPQRRFIDVVKGDMQSDRRMVKGRCRQVISCSDNVVSSENGNVKRKAK